MTVRKCAFGCGAVNAGDGPVHVPGQECRGLKAGIKKVERFREDVIAVASKMQNDPAAFADALRDRHTTKEMQRLVGDLFSLAEVIVNDAFEEEAKR